MLLPLEMIVGDDRTLAVTAHKLPRPIVTGLSAKTWKKQMEDKMSARGY